MWRWGVSLGALMLALARAEAAQAQSTTLDPPPPIVQNLDGNGVDLTSGMLSFSAKQVSIGPATGALTRVKENFQVEDNLYGVINISGSTYTVSFGGGSETFTLANGSYTSNQQVGSIFTYNSTSGVYSYTRADGSIVGYASYYNNTSNSAVQENGAQIVSYTSPTGEIWTYNYYDEHTQSGPKSEPRYKDTYYLTSVTSNRALQIKYNYQSPASPGAIMPLISVQAVNNALDACNPSDYNPCANTSQTWPIATFSGTSASDPLNRTTNYGAPAASTTQTITRPAGDYMSYTYNATNQVTSATNGVGIWTYGYSVSGGVLTTTIKDPNGKIRAVTSSTTLNEIAMDTDPIGRITSYTYDNGQAGGPGRLTQVTYPHGNSVQYVYDSHGNVTQTTQVATQGSGLPNTVTSATFPCATAATCNKPGTTTDAKLAVTNYTYNQTTGQLTSVSRPAVAVGTGSTQTNPQTTYTYNPFYANVKTSSGSITSEPTALSLLTDVSTCNTTASCAGTADETHTHITYDPNHNLAASSVTTYAGNVTLGTGANGLPSCPANSTCSAQSFTYDAFGNLATSTSPLGAVTTYVYDADRELTGVIGPDPDGSGPLISSATQVIYDADGRVSSTKTGSVNGASDTGFSSFTLNTLESFNYDQAGRLASINDGLVTSGSLGSTFAARQYQYDNANNLQCSAVRMNMALVGPLPTACNQSTAGVDGPDQITYRGYNADNSVATIASGFGTASSRNDVSNTYNTADGTLGSKTDANGNVTCYSYDGFGRVTKVQFPSPSSAGSCNASDYETYVYDANGNLTSKSERNGFVLTYGYDALNRLISESTNAGVYSTFGYDLQGRVTDPNTGGLTAHMAYDALGRRTLETNGFGGQVASAYDAASDRTQLTWQNGQSVSYTYDPLGRMNTIADAASQIASYRYDSFGRMTGANYTGTAYTLGQGFQYGSDNRLSLTGYGFADTSKNLYSWLTYNAAGQIKVRTLSNDLYDWNNSASVNQTYTTNGLNQVTAGGATSYTYDQRGLLGSDGTYHYSYDGPHNQLIGLSGGGSSASLAYDALHRLAQVQGSNITRFIYDGSAISEEINQGGGVLAMYVPGPDGSPVLWYNGAGTGDRRWLLKDQQGSVIAVANGSGQALGVYSYDAYGLQGGSNPTRFQYAGYPYILEVDLYNTGERSYSPKLGRFLQTDPIGYGDGMNWYAYTHGDPVNGSDPSGLICVAPAAQDKHVVYVCAQRQSTAGPDTSGGLSSNDLNGNRRGQDLPPKMPKPQGKPSQHTTRNRCLVKVLSRVGDDLQNYGLLTGLGGGLLTAIAPQALVGEAAVTGGVALYSAGSALKDSISISNLIFNSGNGTGYVLSQVNNLALNGIPEGPGRDLVEHALDQAEEKAGLDNGDGGVCGGG